MVPGLTLRRIEEGCSGMAGAWGLTKDNFRMSIRLGWPLITRMRQDDLQLGTTECSSCRIQMEQGTTKPTLHPIKLLALAYGLMPEMRGRLTGTSGRLVVS
jgi:Fe-S oxidoreductase